MIKSSTANGSRSPGTTSAVHCGRELQVSPDPLHPDADAWWWRVTRKHSGTFWDIVRKHGCLVIDDINRAVRGILFLRAGGVVVLYDYPSALQCLDGTWNASTPALVQKLSDEGRNKLNAWVFNGVGDSTPAWLNVDMTQNAAVLHNSDL